MLANDELRASIPLTKDPKKPFHCKRHEEIDSLLCRHKFSQYELQLLKQDIETLWQQIQDRSLKRRAQKAKEGSQPTLFEDGI